MFRLFASILLAALHAAGGAAAEESTAAVGATLPRWVGDFALRSQPDHAVEALEIVNRALIVGARVSVGSPAAPGAAAAAADDGTTARLRVGLEVGSGMGDGILVATKPGARSDGNRKLLRATHGTRNVLAVGTQSGVELQSTLTVDPPGEGAGGVKVRGVALEVRTSARDDGIAVATINGASAPLALTADARAMEGGVEGAAAGERGAGYPIVAMGAMLPTQRVQSVLSIDAAGKGALDARLAADASLALAAALDVDVSGAAIALESRSGGTVRIADAAVALSAAGISARFSARGGFALHTAAAAASGGGSSSGGEVDGAAGGSGAQRAEHVHGVLSTAADGFGLLSQLSTGQLQVHRGGIDVEAGGLRIGAGGAVVAAGGVAIDAGGLDVRDGGVTLSNSGGAGLHVRDGGALVENPDDNGAALTAAAKGKFFVNSVLRLHAARADANSGAFRFVEGFVGGSGGADGGADGAGGGGAESATRSFAIFGNGDIATAGSLRAAGGIDGSALGATTPASGRFTTLEAANGLDATSVGTTQPRPGHFTVLTASEGVDGTKVGAVTAASGRFTTLEATAGLDATTIGASAPSAGAFTTLIAVSGLDGTTSALVFFVFASRALYLPLSTVAAFLPLLRRGAHPSPFRCRRHSHRRLRARSLSPPPPSRGSRRERPASRDGQRSDGDGRHGRNPHRCKDTIDGRVHDSPRVRWYRRHGDRRARAAFRALQRGASRCGRRGRAPRHAVEVQACLYGGGGGKQCDRGARGANPRT